MDQESGAATGGSLISLNENEQRCYSGLHSLCQADSSGKLSASKVGELLRSSQLPADTLHQITEVCGAKRLGYFGTGQFYAALKLLAAAQSGRAVRLEAVTADLPLPRFLGMKNEAELRYSGQPPGVEAQGQPCVLGAAPTPASVPWSAGERSALRHPDTNLEKKEHWSPPRSPCGSPPRSPSTYHSYLYATQRNGTDTQVAYESKHPLSRLEQHSSPGHYSIKACPEQPAIARAPSVERLDGRRADDHSDDPWRITEEQREYYTNQFRTLQPDLGALVLGTIAKNFFTKSKLPIPELSHIWELSDADRDGALTFSEFCTAFHLIVARKNGYPLPKTLPPTLRPGVPEQGEDMPGTPESTEPLIVFEDMEPRPCQSDQSKVEVSSPRPGQTTSKQDLREEPRKQEFSLKRVVITSGEKHPLRVGAFPGRPEPPHELDTQMKSRTRPRSYSSTSIDDAMKKTEEPPTPPPRPQKTHSRASSLDLNKLFQQGSQGIKSGWFPPPPALPPRPPTSQIPLFIGAAEKTPQKKVPQPNFADFSHFREEEECGVKTVDQSPLRRAGPSTEDLASIPKQEVPGGPQSQSQAPQKPVRRKFRPESQNLEATPPPSAPFVPATKPAQKLPPRQKREIQTAIRKNKETNAVLTRLNSELQQQLKEVHQERISLESQLEILRPLASV